MGAVDVAVFLVGAAAVVLTMADVFESVIVPRTPSTRYRISFLVWRTLWKLWPRVGALLYKKDAGALEEFLATFAPFALITLLVTWMVVLVFGYGAMLFALRGELNPVPHSYWDAAYFAGTSLLTLGFGDIVAREGFARFISLCAGGTGFAVFSITTAFLFAIFGTFQRRESFIVTFSARAGSPPSAIGLFEIAAKTKTQQSLHGLMRDAQDWAASLMESHLAYPVLAYFRSSHDDESWIGTLGALLDASLIAHAMLDEGDHGEARIFFAIGRHAVNDLARFYEIDRSLANDPGIARADFDQACDRLAAAGYALLERDAAWDAFSRARAEYAGHLTTMARYFHIPPVAWIGSLSERRAQH